MPVVGRHALADNYFGFECWSLLIKSLHGAAGRIYNMWKKTDCLGDICERSTDARMGSKAYRLDGLCCMDIPTVAVVNAQFV